MNNLSRTFLLKWLNDQGIKIERIEEIGKGVVICMLFKRLDDEFPVFKKDPWNENDYLYNLKQIESYFNRKGIKMYFPVEKMIKLKMQDNLEVLQSIYKYLNGRGSDVVKRGSDVVKRGNDVVKGNNGKPGNTDKIDDIRGNASNNHLNEKEDSILEMNKKIEILKNEREFYFKKLVKIEKILKEDNEENEIKEKIFQIMYKE